MAPKYKLTYFNMPGRAEPIRFIFAYAGQDYEDFRINLDQWAEIKPSTPFGQVPVLEVDGKLVGESRAICRYLAKQFNLLGENDWEALQADMFVDALESCKQVIMRTMKETDPDKIKEIKQQAANFLKKFDEAIASNPAGLLVGSKVTWADLYFAASLPNTIERHPDIAKPFSALTSLIKQINNLPSIKEWLEKRPKSDFVPPPRN
ncbi:glutathione S-transferase-like [Anthonomus grandis grandis]|uniref:glutathione S-transferase-like n=1 Tax=Anthonomus grandis grandis TaxID=2921223 RepID=UPI002166056D|nr:glutathione S-transferase-like [Anthonomus grandis grandis]